MFSLHTEDDEFEEIQAKLKLLEVALREFPPQHPLVPLVKLELETEEWVSG